MTRQKRIVAQAPKSRIGTEIGVMVDGPSPEHELVLQGRIEGQAPDIDAVVYLTDCDPAAYRPGELVRAQIVERAGYDLVAAPVGVDGRPAGTDRRAVRLPNRPPCRGVRADEPEPRTVEFTVLYSWVPASSKVTRVGLCPLFLFQGLFTAQTERLAGVRAAADASRAATGWRFSTSSSGGSRSGRCCG